MNFIDKAERFMVGKTIPNLTLIFIVGQAIAFILAGANPELNVRFALIGGKVLEGEVWRLLTFFFFPMRGSIIFVAFGLYLLYIYGNALESHWGSARYNLYILLSYIATIIVSLVFPHFPMTNIYLYASIFLGFAFLFPNFTLLLFFILPIKIKWLAWLAWFGFAVNFVTGNPPEQAQIAIIAMVFALFFYDELKSIVRAKLGESRSHSKRAKPRKKKHYHKCTICGKTEVSDPDMEIRYCNKCIPEKCYCGRHILDHKHKVVN